MNNFKSDFQELLHLSELATPGPWSVPHLCRDDIDCNCPYVFADGQRSMGCICDLVFDDNKELGESLEDTKANGRLLVAAVNFIRDHAEELKIKLDMK